MIWLAIKATDLYCSAKVKNEWRCSSAHPICLHDMHGGNSTCAIMRNCDMKNASVWPLGTIHKPHICTGHSVKCITDSISALYVVSALSFIFCCQLCSHLQNSSDLLFMFWYGMGLLNVVCAKHQYSNYCFIL